MSFMAKEMAVYCSSKPDLMKTWSVNDTKKLIRCVKAYSHLYDPSEPLFGNEDSDREAFENIAKVFNKSDFQCMARWYDIEQKVANKKNKGLEYNKELEFLIKIRAQESDFNIKEEVDVSFYEVPEVRVNSKTASANKSFFRCVKDGVKKLSPDQQSTFKITIMNQLHYLLYEKPKAQLNV